MKSRILLAVALAVVAGGCTDSNGSRENAAEGEGWTVLHYSMADTDLEGFMVGDLNEMGEVGSQGALKLRAFVDRSPEYSDDDALGLGDWIGGKIIDVGAEESTVVEELEDVDSADPKVLADFIAQGMKDLPADNYALIISDHGASWPGIGPDETADANVLNLAELTEGIKDGLEEAGVDKLDLLGFDACLMASYEVASAVAPLADRMVASQELEPGHGWDYTTLQLLADEGSTTADEFGSALVEGFKGQAEDEGTDASITLALLDLTKMDAVDEAVADFAESLTEDVSTVAPTIGRANREVLGFARSPDETEDAHLKDLGLFAAAVAQEQKDFEGPAGDVVDALQALVVDSVAGESTADATGLSIYFPPVVDLADGRYKEVESAEAWIDFLSAFYEAGDDIPEAELPEFEDADDGADVEIDEEGLTISGTFDETGADNLVEATISYALINEDGTLTYFGDEYAEIAEDGSPQAEGFYDLTALKISDGEDEAYAYISLLETDDEDVFTVDVPMAYYPAGETENYEDVLLSLTIDGESGDILDETYYVFDEESETYGELEVDPEGIIVPEVLRIDANGEEVWEPTTDIGLFAELENLEYNFEPLPSGTAIQVDLTVYDYGDNSDTISTQLNVP